MEEEREREKVLRGEEREREKQTDRETGPLGGPLF